MELHGLSPTNASTCTDFNGVSFLDNVSIRYKNHKNKRYLQQRVAHDGVIDPVLCSWGLYFEETKLLVVLVCASHFWGQISPLVVQGSNAKNLQAKNYLSSQNYLL